MLFFSEFCVVFDTASLSLMYAQPIWNSRNLSTDLLVQPTVLAEKTYAGHMRRNFLSEWTFCGM
jgi:hypothetical protein